jgi:hypothetical protein
VPDLFGPTVDLSFPDNLNDRSDGFYRMEFEDPVNAAKGLEGLEVSDWSWIDDIFASCKDGAVKVPLQATSLFNKTNSESSNDPPTGLPNRNEFLGVDSIEAERIKISGESTAAQSQSFQEALSFERSAPIPNGQKHRKTGRRTRPLSLEMKKKVASIRRLKACWLCWLSKIPASNENPFPQ